VDEVAIARAGSSDLEALVTLAVAFRDHLGQADPAEVDFRAAFAALLAEGSADFVLARTATGVALGYAAVRYRPSAWEHGRVAELEDLFVIAAARRRGVGRRLVQAVLSAAAARGCRKVGLQTNERNAPALALYRRLGFTAERARWEEGRQLWLERRLASGSDGRGEPR
jgi:ribosomal protein S18 acetylase RimI-like enzyme